MRFLIDNNLSGSLVSILQEAGHDVVHVRDLDMRAATDDDVLDKALSDERILISADTDFGTLLARRRTRGPSVLLVRALVGRRAADQGRLIETGLELVAGDLLEGAVVALTEKHVRIRRLPLLP